ncbi:unnamed protein product [Sphagnum balticum]
MSIAPANNVTSSGVAAGDTIVASLQQCYKLLQRPVMRHCNNDGYSATIHTATLYLIVCATNYHELNGAVVRGAATRGVIVRGAIKRP